MKKLFTEFEFNQAKSKQLLPCECYTCKKVFYITKHQIQKALNPSQTAQGKYCSKKCQPLLQKTSLKVTCLNCGKEFEKQVKRVKKFPNNFCCQSCAATYNNTHKTYGIRRSKLEIYLEEQLKSLYPNLHFDFNKKDAINSELDIYIPSLNLAFELNGIFHYEPIYGSEKLTQIQNNDQRKFQACLEKNIELVLIDVSQLDYFKEQKAIKFLEIIKTIINSKLYCVSDSNR